MSQIYKKILIVKRFGVKKIGENAIVKLNEAIKDLTPNSNRPHPRPQSGPPPPPPPPPPRAPPEPPAAIARNSNRRHGFSPTFSTSLPFLLPT